MVGVGLNTLDLLFSDCNLTVTQEGRLRKPHTHSHARHIINKSKQTNILVVINYELG
jgi:hypothetical protein